MVGWHLRLNGHEFEWAPKVSEGQRSLASCSPWDHKKSETIEWLNWTEEVVKDLKVEKMKAYPLSLLLLSHSVMSNSLGPHRWQPTKLPCPWGSPGKNIGVGFHWKVKGKSLSRVWLLATPWTVAHRASLSMEFSRQEYCSVLPFPPPGDPPHPGIEPGSLALQVGSLSSEPPVGGAPRCCVGFCHTLTWISHGYTFWWWWSWSVHCFPSPSKQRP